MGREPRGHGWEVWLHAHPGHTDLCLSGVVLLAGQPAQPCVCLVFPALGSKLAITDTSTSSLWTF